MYVLVRKARPGLRGRHTALAATLRVEGHRRCLQRCTASTPCALALRPHSPAPVPPCAAAVLIRTGASPDVPVLRGLQPRLPYLSGGSTALHIAAYQGDARMCLVLLEAQWRQPGVELRRLRNARGLVGGVPAGRQRGARL